MSADEGEDDFATPDSETEAEGAVDKAAADGANTFITDDRGRVEPKLEVIACIIPELCPSRKQATVA